jgi:hypothetical protein
MRRALGASAAAVALAIAAAPAAHAAHVDLLVVGKGERVLRAAKPLTLRTATVRVGHRRCRVAAATPLAVLARTGLPLRLRDYGSCSRRTRDATALYVRGIGRQLERGLDGWVFKIGRRAPSTGAGDPGSRLRAGARVTWFWCRNGAAGCQRTLEVRPATRTAAPGSQLRVTVRAYDDHGSGVPAGGATVRLGSATATADASGIATLTVPAGAATLSLMATAHGLVPSFPVQVSTA